jgi:RNA polymerase sigma-70 factor (ECF subfamily)
VEIAFESPERSLAGERGNPHPIEAAQMTRPEFDYEGLIRPMEARMMRSIWRIVRGREAAEDALQDALTVVWRKREVVARHPNPQALILRISIDAAYDAVRRDRRRLRREIAGLPGQFPDAGAFSVARDAELRGLRARVLEAIGRLPKKQATAALLRLVEERSYAEIAGAMGCSETTVRVHVMRARAALSRRLGCERPRPSDGHGEGGKEGLP